ncbi:MAG TPA: aminotransferase [Elusimicrobia bacterium]|nr:aminotransferase [Elusimicrobiota bacterium]
MDFLNHGSFGAAPKSVLAAQGAWRREMERQPVVLLDGRLPKLLRGRASRLAAFLGARGEDLAFVDNATTGVNTVLRSFPWRRGEELLLATHAYPAVKAASLHAARRAGARVRLARIPFPPKSETQLLQAFQAALTKRTRLAVIDHVSSPTALVFPVRELAALCRKAGVKVLVDGAHAPGMLDLDVPSIGADWYVGNCHKWLFAPKGCAFLWASKEGKRGLHPLSISSRLDEGFAPEFDWCGTKDPTPWLSLDAALAFYRSLGGVALRRRNRELALSAGRRLAAAWGAERAPEALCASMVSFLLPFRGKAGPDDVKRIHAALWRRRIEVPLFHLDGKLLIRISAQAYNEPGDYETLEKVLPGLLKG